MKLLATIASQAAKARLEFLLAGGHAVITHGFARSTFDLDLIVARNDCEKWLQLAQHLGYTLKHQGPTFLQFNAAERDTFPLDLMLVNAETFSKLRADAISIADDTERVWVVSLMHLLALKCHAIKHGHPGRIVKDADDVIRLVQKNGLDVGSTALRELFLKHGTEEFYNKVRRAAGSIEQH